MTKTNPCYIRPVMNTLDINFIPVANRPVALVPAYKPDAKLIKIAKDLVETQTIQCVYCIDDGSGESFAHIFNELIKLGVRVLRHKVNLGKGMALRTGLNTISCNHPDTVGVITFDADGQHLVNDISKVSEKLLSNQTALILGSREIDQSAPLRSRFGNSVTRHTLRFFTGIKLEDTQTGLRGIPAALIPALLRLKTTGYDFELDMLICAKQQKIEMIEVPIETVYIDENESSHFNPILDSIKIYFVFLRFSSVSLITASIDYLVFSIMFLSSSSLLLSMIICRLVAASFQFTVSHSFVFKKKGSWISAAQRYFVVLLLLSTLSYFGMYSAMKFLNISPLISKVFTEGTIFLLSFLLQRDFVFSNDRVETYTSVSEERPRQQ